MLLEAQLVLKESRMARTIVQSWEDRCRGSICLTLSRSSCKQIVSNEVT